MSEFKWFKPSTWFNSKERKELQLLREQNTIIENKLGSVSNNLETLIEAERRRLENNFRPFRSMRYLGGNLIVVLNDGVVLQKAGTKEDFQKALTLSTENDIISFFTNEEIKQKIENEKLQKNSEVIETFEDKKQVIDNLKVLRDNQDFEVEENTVYLKGVRLAMPAIVAGSFIELLERIEGEKFPNYPDRDEEKIVELEEKYEALKMFWMKLALNPIPQSRLDLLGFVKRNDVRITGNGNLILYRRIVSKGNRADKKLVAAISQLYTKVKKNKKSPKNYELILKEREYSIVKAQEEYDSETESIGNLYELYQNLPSMKENTYTAAHTNTVEIKIGAVYYIPDNEINLNNGLCAEGGLHAACKDYDYSSFGNTPVVVLVSPSKAITVPISDGGKLRTTEMFIACVNDTAKGKHFEGALSTFDEEYNNYTLAVLEKALEEKSLGDLNIKTEKPAIQLVDVEQIVNHIKGRVKSGN